MKNIYRFNATYNLVISIIGLLLGILLMTLQDSIAVYIFQIIGIITIVFSIIRLVSFFTFDNGFKWNFVSIEALINLILGFVMFLFPVRTIGIILGCILIVLPLYNIFTSKDKKETFKKELIKLALGVILVILGPSNTLKYMFYIAGAIISICSIISLVLYIVSFIKSKRKTKKEEKESEVIDV